jgi:hypothetical protein
MQTSKPDIFDSLISRLLTRFDTDPYSLSKSELEILKLFSKNQKPLQKLATDEIFRRVRINLAADFVITNVNEDVKKK